MDDENFIKYVDIAVANLPQEFKQKLNNVSIVVEDFPTRNQLIRLNIPPGSLLFGLYEGIPQTKRKNYGVGPTMPDKITIFKYSILYVSSSEEDMIRRIGETVRHEIAHHFGMDEDQIRKARTKKLE